MDKQITGISSMATRQVLVVRVKRIASY
jgi:hypothetical protein